MKTKSILSLTAALLTVASARAEVVIYKGILRNTGDFSTQTGTPKPLTVFVAVDYGSHEIGLIYFGTTAAGKHFNEGSPGSIRITTAPLVGGKTATLLSVGSVMDNGPTDYQQTVSLLRGTNATLTIATTPSIVLRNLPRAIVGNSTIVSATGALGHFSLTSYGLTQDLKKTVEANNANRSIQQAMDDVAAGLKKLGYVTP